MGTLGRENRGVTTLLQVKDWASNACTAGPETLRQGVPRAIQRLGKGPLLTVAATHPRGLLEARDIPRKTQADHQGRTQTICLPCPEGSTLRTCIKSMHREPQYDQKIGRGARPDSHLGPHRTVGD